MANPWDFQIAQLDEADLPAPLMPEGYLPPMPMTLPEQEEAMQFRTRPEKMKLAPQGAPAGVQPGFDPSSGGPKNAYEEAFKKMMEDRMSHVQQLRQQLSEAQANKPTGFAAIDAKPFMALGDQLTGGKTSDSYSGPQAVIDNKALQARLQDLVEKGQNGLSDDQLNYLKMKSMEAYRMDANDARRQAMSGMNDYRQQKLAQGDDRLAMAAGKNIDNDSIVRNLFERRQQIGRDRHTLDTAAVITPQIFDELQKGVANAITGAKSASVSDTAAMKIHTIDQDYANLMQRVRSKPQDINNPELKKYMSDLLARLDDAYVQNMNDRKGQLTAGMQHLSSPKAKALVQSKSDALGGKSSGDGKITVTNGTETLHISPEDLEHAKADGFQEVNK